MISVSKQMEKAWRRLMAPYTWPLGSLSASHQHRWSDLRATPEEVDTGEFPVELTGLVKPRIVSLFFCLHQCQNILQLDPTSLALNPTFLCCKTASAAKKFYLVSQNLLIKCCLFPVLKAVKHHSWHQSYFHRLFNSAKPSRCKYVFSGASCISAWT